LPNVNLYRITTFKFSGSSSDLNVLFLNVFATGQCFCLQTVETILPLLNNGQFKLFCSSYHVEEPVAVSNCDGYGLHFARIFGSNPCHRTWWQ